MSTYTPSPELVAAMDEYRKALAAVDAKREAAYEAMAADMKAHGLGNADMAKHVDMSEEGVRKAVKGRGVPRKTPGFKPRTHKGIPPRPIRDSAES